LTQRRLSGRSECKQLLGNRSRSIGCCGFSRNALSLCSRPFSKRAKSLRIRKLIFRNDPLDIPRLALDAVSNKSICLYGHTLNDSVNHWWISCGTSLWTLGLVANVFIQLIGVWHVSTSGRPAARRAGYATRMKRSIVFELRSDRPQTIGRVEHRNSATSFRINCLHHAFLEIDRRGQRGLSSMPRTKCKNEGATVTTRPTPCAPYSFSLLGSLRGAA
jgi:hypothetical protein